MAQTPRIQDYLTSSAERFPEKEVLIDRGGRKTYAQLLAASTAVSRWLAARRLERGFRAAILTDDPFDYVTSYFGILLAGGIVVGMNTQTSDRTLVEMLGDCEASIVLTDFKFRKHFPALLGLEPALGAMAVRDWQPDWQPDGPSGAATLAGARCHDYAEVLAAGGDRLPDLPSTAPGDVAQIIYTSGTTGSPKGVVLGHGNLVANTSSIVEYLGLTADDRIMAVLPFFYSYGNSLLLTHLAVGGSLVVNQQFVYPNVILDDMVAESATGFSGVPSTFAILLNRSAVRDYEFPALRYVTQAGGPMSPALALALEELLPGVKIYIMYGQTEASARLSYLEPEEIERKSGSIGRAIPGVTLELRDGEGDLVRQGEVGEIVARGGNIMRGYWGRPEATSEVLRDGALWTGDLARQDEEGYFFIVGRKTDMIKSGSHRIGPKEIEDALQEYPAVDEVAVVGVADEILGEAIEACVVLKPGASASSRELTIHCRDLLPVYMVPRRFVFLDELPKTTTGKVRRPDLRTAALREVPA